MLSFVVGFINFYAIEAKSYFEHYYTTSFVQWTCLSLLELEYLVEMFHFMSFMYQNRVCLLYLCKLTVRCDPSVVKRLKCGA
jgi:hypothetical protein